MTIDGATFALDAPVQVDAVWGDGSHVLWAKGEPLMIAKPDGVGGTTIAQQLVLAIAGIRPPTLLGHTITPDPARRVLYLALDRPRQASRSMRRMVGGDDRALLEHRLVVQEGELPFDVVAEPRRLLAFAQEQSAGTVVIDSLKDVAAALKEEAPGQAINKAMQVCVAAGVEVLALHHQRKAQAENKKPSKLADVYGSRWLTAGCGSVLMIWGEAGDPVVELTHLKQPGEVVGPLTLEHDNHAGTTRALHTAADVVDLLRASGKSLTAKQVATSLFKVPKPKENDIAKAKRRLRAAVKDGKAEQLDTADGMPALWVVKQGVDAAPPIRGPRTPRWTLRVSVG
jgi:replicative DNA helicase